MRAEQFSVLTTTESEPNNLVVLQQQNLGWIFGTSIMHLSPSSPHRWYRLLSVLRRWFCCCWSVLVCLRLVVGVMCLSLFCCALLCVLSSFAIILKRKRGLLTLLLLSYGWFVTVNVLWLFPRCHGLVWCVWLWYFLIILTYFLRRRN